MKDKIVGRMVCRDGFSDEIIIDDISFSNNSRDVDIYFHTYNGVYYRYSQWVDDYHVDLRIQAGIRQFYRLGDGIWIAILYIERIEFKEEDYKHACKKARRASIWC